MLVLLIKDMLQDISKAFLQQGLYVHLYNEKDITFAASCLHDNFQNVLFSPPMMSSGPSPPPPA